MKNIFRDIEENFQTKELVLSFLLTALFLFLTIIAYIRFTAVTIVWDTKTLTIHASFYGYPFEMVRVLTPVGSYENLEIEFVTGTGGGLIEILWSGLVLNFALYFSLAFAIVYSAKKLRNRWFAA